MFKLFKLSIAAFLLIFVNLNEINAADEDKGLYGFYLGQTFSEIIKNSASQEYSNIEINIQRDISEINVLKNKISSELPSITTLNVRNNYEQIKNINSGAITFLLKEIDKKALKYLEDLDMAQNFQMSLTSDKYKDFKYDLITIVLYPSPGHEKPLITISVVGKYGNINDIMDEKSALIKFRYRSLNQTLTEKVINILKQRFGGLKIFNVFNEQYIYSYKDGILIEAGDLKSKSLDEIEMIDFNPLMTYTKYYIDLKAELKKIKESKSKSLDGI